MKKLVAVLVLLSCSSAHATLPIVGENTDCMLAVVNGDGSGSPHNNYADAVIVTGWGGHSFTYGGNTYNEVDNEILQ